MNLQRSLVNLVRVAICLAAILWVVRGVQLSEVSAAWQNADKWLLAAGLMAFLLTPLLQAVRLWRLLAVQGVHISLVESVRLAFAGNFLNFAAPIGSTSGDVFKAIYVGRRCKQSWEAATTIFVDRGVGLGTLLLSVTVIALLAGGQSRLASLRGYLTLLSLGLLAGGLLVVTLPLWKRTPAARWLDRLPKRDVLLRIARATRILLASPRTLLLAVIDTLGIQIAAAGSFLCVALALGFRLDMADWTALYAFFSTGELVKALPGPPQGLGTMELTYGFLLADWAGPAQILSSAIAIRTVALLASLPGAAAAVSWISGERRMQETERPHVPAEDAVLVPAAVKVR